MWETQVQSLGWEDPPEKGVAAHSSFLVQRIPWTEKPGGLPKSWTRLSNTFILNHVKICLSAHLSHFEKPLLLLQAANLILSISKVRAV